MQAGAVTGGKQVCLFHRECPVGNALQVMVAWPVAVQLKDWRDRGL